MSILALENDGVGSFRALAASLPASVRMVERDGDVVLIDGAGDWPARLLARIEAGQKRFIVIDPQVAQAEHVFVKAQAAGADITLCERHADSPTVAEFRAGLTGQFAAVTITGQGDAGMADLILQQLRLARAAGFAPGAILHVAGDADRVMATLQAAYGEETVLLRLTAVVSRAGGGHHRLLTHGRTESACVQVWSDPASRPAAAFHITADQTTQQPTIYESAHRATLRAVLTSGAGQSDGGAWVHDAALAITIAAGG